MEEESGRDAKRPRVGVPHASILAPIEADTVVTGKPRHIRGLILYCGQRRKTGESLSETLLGQSTDLGGCEASDPVGTATVLLEW